MKRQQKLGRPNMMLRRRVSEIGANRLQLVGIQHKTGGLAARLD